MTRRGEEVRKCGRKEGKETGRRTEGRKGSKERNGGTKERKREQG